MISGCQTCTSDCQSVVQIGLAPPDREIVVALAGNPNTGKSTIFNHLTGLRQHTGNWPGKTVTRAEGTFSYHEQRFRVVDLPGTYSLLSRSMDEEIARNFLLFGRPDCTVVVCDATLLERNLNLVLQILEITPRVAVCLNLIDEAERRQLALQVRALEKELGVPVVPTAARHGQGLDHLMQRISEMVSGEVRTHPVRIPLDGAVEDAVAALVPQLLQLIPNLPCPRWIALRLLDGDTHIEQALLDGKLADLARAPEASNPRAN